MATPDPASAETTHRLVKLSVALFLSYLTIGIPLPVIPLFVHQQLEFNDTMVGVAVGIQFVATVLTRSYAGRLADEKGAKRSAIQGMFSCSLAGLFYILAGVLPLNSEYKFVLLVIGRLCLGCGESQILTGTLAWGLGLSEPGKAGRVMSWTGMAMFGALAVGAPIGLALNQRFGFLALGVCTMILPAMAYLINRNVPTTTVHHGERVPLSRIMRVIWPHGLSLGCQGVGFAVIGAFVSLYFHDNHWDYAGLTLSCFGGAFVLMRIFCGDFPNRYGCIKVAKISICIETIGLVILSTATTSQVALLGATCTGAGCSLVFPSLGVDLVGKVPPQTRGTAMGGYSAFQDISYAVTGPMAGYIASQFGYASVFAVGACCAVCGFILIRGLLGKTPVTNR